MTRILRADFDAFTLSATGLLVAAGLVLGLRRSSRGVVTYSE